MEDGWKPKLPAFNPARCVICGESVTAPPFIASKPRRGPVIYAHTRCFEKEQKEQKERREEGHA